MVKLPGTWCDLDASVRNNLSHSHRPMTHFQSLFSPQLQNIFKDSYRMLDGSEISFDVEVLQTILNGTLKHLCTDDPNSFFINFLLNFNIDQPVTWSYFSYDFITNILSTENNHNAIILTVGTQSSRIQLMKKHYNLISHFLVISFIPESELLSSPFHTLLNTMTSNSFYGVWHLCKRLHS